MHCVCLYLFFFFIIVDWNDDDDDKIKCLKIGAGFIIKLLCARLHPKDTGNPQEAIYFS